MKIIWVVLAVSVCAISLKLVEASCRNAVCEQ